MRGAQRLRDLHAVANYISERQATGRNHLFQGFAWDVLQDQEVDFSITSDVIKDDDVGVVQSGNRASLLKKAALAVRIGGDVVVRQNLNGDSSLQACVSRPVHLAHPAGADVRFDQIRAQLGTGS